MPPLAQVDDPMQTRLRIGQLAFVNDQSRFVLALEHLRDDLVEGHDLGFDPGGKELQRQIRGGQGAGTAIFFFLISSA